MKRNKKNNEKSVYFRVVKVTSRSSSYSFFQLCHYLIFNMLCLVKWKNYAY